MLSAFIMAFLVLTIGCKKNDVPQADATQEKIDAVVDSVRLALETEIGKIVPTLNVFIQTPEGSWFSSSAGEGYQPITADTYFRFASNTKTFTSTSILNMQEDGWLNIDDLITDTIPGSSLPYVPASEAWNIPYKGEITIKMLLQHSAGVYDVDNDSVPGYNGESFTEYISKSDPEHQFTAEEMVEQDALHQLSYFAPGTNHHYSNTGFVMLSEIAGRVYSFHSGSQKHLTDYLHDKITGPTATVPIDAHFPYLATDTEMPEPYSCGHFLMEPDNTLAFCDYNMSGQIGEGNGYATMRDLNTFIRTLIKGENVLTAGTVQQMTTSWSPGNNAYALGCLYTPNLGYGHNGARIGNLSIMVYDPETDVSMIVYLSAWEIPDVMVTLIAIYNTAYATRAALGYPGKPEK